MLQLLRGIGTVPCHLAVENKTDSVFADLPHTCCMIILRRHAWSITAEDKSVLLGTVEPLRVLGALEGP